MRMIFYSLQKSKIYLWLNNPYCRVFHQYGFLCTGFLQLVAISAPLVFPDWIFVASNWNLAIKGFYSWQLFWLHWFSLYESILILIWIKSFYSWVLSKPHWFFPLENYFSFSFFFTGYSNYLASPLIGCRNERCGDNCCRVTFYIVYMWENVVKLPTTHI